LQRELFSRYSAVASNAECQITQACGSKCRNAFDLRFCQYREHLEAAQASWVFLIVISYLIFYKFYF
jgi:hypothetical protein